MQAMQVERRIGGAGTGKTAYVLDQMDRVRSEGVAPSEIALVTFSKSGCEEMRDRAASRWDVPGECLTNFRTAHSHAYRAIGVTPDQLLTDDDSSLIWIGDHLGIDLLSDRDASSGSGWRPRNLSGSDESVSLRLWNLARLTLRPISEVLAERTESGDPNPDPEVFNYTVERYESAKRTHERKDYTDILLDYAGIRMHFDGPQPCQPCGELPEGLKALFVDECQDNSALVDAALRRLAEGAGVRYTLLVGDPMQSIFEGFAGGSAQHFMGWEATQSVMPQSFRCPAPILELGERCLQEMSNGYWDRGIKPADHRGVITQAGSSYDAIEEHVDLSKSTLILARCSYSLHGYAEILRDMSIPYAFVGGVRDEDFTAFLTLRAIQAGEVFSGSHWKATISLLPAVHSSLGPLLRRGAKADWSRGAYDFLDLLRAEDLELAGCTPEFAELIRQGHATDMLPFTMQEKFARWEFEARQHGIERLTRPPVRLATIHAAKGLEADIVVLSTQSSRRVERGRDLSRLVHDVECRLHYVAVTRAKEKLVIVEDGTRERLILPW